MLPNRTTDTNYYHVFINNFSGGLFIKESERQEVINTGQQMAARLKDTIKSRLAGPINLCSLNRLVALQGFKLRITSKGCRDYLPLACGEINLPNREIKINRRLWPRVRRALKLWAIDINTTKLGEIMVLHELMHLYLADIASISGNGKMRHGIKGIAAEEVAISELIRQILALGFNPIIISIVMAGIKRAPAAQPRF